MTDLSPETNADLIRLEHAVHSQLNDTLKSLLDRGEALDKVAEIIERRIDNGAYVLNEHLAALIVHTKSWSLYTKTRKQLFPDTWALLALYKGRYPDPEIEKVLCDSLYQVASNDTDWRRQAIAEAMRDVGSNVVLPTLEALLFDHSPNLEVKQMILQAMESAGASSVEALLMKFETGSRRQFVASVAEAINAIKKRGNARRGANPGEALASSTHEVMAPPQSQDTTKPSTRDGLEHIELQLHSHTKRRLQERYGRENDDWWFKGIPSSIREECVKRRESDSGRHDPFSYSYLIDLKTVLDRNWSVFEPDFTKIRHIVASKKEFLNQIALLNDVRNRYAHPTRAPAPRSEAADADYKFVTETARIISSFCGE